MDFRPLTLPVTCGQAKGILHKEKMEQGGFPALLHFQLETIPVDNILFRG